MSPPRLPARILVGPALRAQPDWRLVALAREGHEPALEEVVRRYRPALVHYAATIVSADRADDVVQDSIAKALPAIRGGDGELHLRPWLYTIVRNTAFNNIRDAGPAMDHLDESFDGVEQPPQALERREELAAMVAGVGALPDAQREALVKREMEGMSHSEIGSALGVSGGAARQLIHRGRMTLREGLGALIPMPVMRQLLEGMSGPAVAGTGAGGALAAKAAVALLAAGGALTAGVALHHHSHDSAKADPIVAESRSPENGGGRGGGSREAAEGRTVAASRQGSDAARGGDSGAGNRSPVTSLGSAAAGTAQGPGDRSHGRGGSGEDGAGLDPGEGGGSHGGDDAGEHHGGEGGHPEGDGGSEGHSGTGGGDGGGEGSGEHSSSSGEGSGGGGEEPAGGSGGGGVPDGSGEGSSGEGGSSGSGSGEPERPESE